MYERFWKRKGHVASVILLLLSASFALVFLSTPASAADVSLPKVTCTADSYYSGLAGFGAPKACDGSNVGTGWLSNATYPHWLAVDMGAIFTVNKVSMQFNGAGIRNGSLQRLEEGVGWLTVASFVNVPSPSSNYSINASFVTRSLRIFGTTGFAGGNVLYASMSEIWIFGGPSPQGVITSKATGVFTGLIVISVLVGMVVAVGIAAGFKMKDTIRPVYVVMGAAIVVFFLAVVLIPYFFGG